jgi:hypothetical protein
MGRHGIAREGAREPDRDPGFIPEKKLITSKRLIRLHLTHAGIDYLSSESCIPNTLTSQTIY